MKKLVFISLLTLGVGCKAQNFKLNNLSKNVEMNYIFARIVTEDVITKDLYDRGLFATIYRISDTKKTTEDYSDGDEFLSSYIISVVPDSDYYTDSVLYKLEGFINPKILEIKETKYPNFIVKIEYGSFLNERKIEKFEIRGSE